ncbi:MAG: 1-acyl-sn-glycerol-3-phosphate acyltransferase [Prolixibacteraceae bacterium]
MKNWSAGYEILRTYVRFAFWLTHKKIIVTGLQNIPKDKPVIFAPNHQNALMDPLAVVCTNPRQTLWLARADIFKAKATRSVLKFMKMLPVYRIRDGKDNLSNNEQIFARVIGFLEEKKSVGLFPEAAHSYKRQMLPHKKAVPRIALEAEEKNNFRLNLNIVPVGIYYDHYWIFNRILIVRYGTPIEADKYRDEYTENPQKAMLSLRDAIFEQISQLTLQIESKTHYHNYEEIRQLAHSGKSELYFFSKKRILQQFEAENKLIAALERLEIENPPAAQNLIDETNRYFTEIRKAGLTDEQILTAHHHRNPETAGLLIAAILSLPVFCFGLILNAIPFYVPRIFFQRKVKDMAFMSTFNFVAGLVIFPIVYLAEASLIFSLTNSLPISISALFLMPFAGKISYQLLEFYQKVRIRIFISSGNKSFRKKLEMFWKKRNELIKFPEV